MSDAVRALTHDHADINRRVLMLSASIRSMSREPPDASAEVLEPTLVELRESLFLHFAREEEGLFPFVAEVAPELEERVRAMASVHDAICGALSRLVHLASMRSPMTAVIPVFERFESAYAAHAQTEASVLSELEDRLSPQQRTRLATLIEGL